jgi:hypothetical protein
MTAGLTTDREIPFVIHNVGFYADHFRKLIVSCSLSGSSKQYVWICNSDSISDSGQYSFSPYYTRFLCSLLQNAGCFSFVLSNISMHFDQVYRKMHPHLQHQIGSIKSTMSTMKYVLLVHLFGIVFL